jgi:hypothetical protein
MVIGLLELQSVVVLIPDRPKERRKLSGNLGCDGRLQEIINNYIRERPCAAELLGQGRKRNVIAQRTWKWAVAHGYHL